MDLELTDRRVLVTGASRGIGLAIAERFLAEGARIALLARTKNTLESTRTRLEDRYGSDRVLSLPADCGKPSDWEFVLSQVEEQWDGLDVCVANVGDGRSVSEPLPDGTSFSQCWYANFTAAEETARACLPLLKASGGCLLFISSIAGLEAIGAPTDYSVAKTAVMALSKNLARKLAPRVRVNCLAPGNIYFAGGSWDEKRQADPRRVDDIIESSVPMKRFGTPDEIADAAVFLCSARANFITGSVLRVDGGQTVGLF